MPLAILLLVAAISSAWHPQPSGSTVELRGLTALDSKHAWACGFGGTVLRTQNGDHWEKLPAPAGGEALDFRDMEALGGGVLVLMSAGTGDAARIYRSIDAGATWTLANTNPDKDGFYDAIAFWDAKNGLVMGDPVAGRFVVRATQDGGATWAVPQGLVMPEALPGEGAFAASGTCLFALKGGTDAWFVTGGAKVARVSTRRTAAAPGRLRTHRRPTATPRPASSRSPSSTPVAATPPAATTRFPRSRA